MPFSVADKLVVAVSTSALFDLQAADKIFQEKGEQAYLRHMRELEDVILEPGPAFPFVKRLLRVNRPDQDWSPVEVVILSRNSADTALRAMRSVAYYGLPISRGAFTRGQPPFRYMRPFNAKLFLSTNKSDVHSAIAEGHPAGLILPSKFEDETDDEQLRIAFDFDGILADDTAEAVFQDKGLEGFHAHEQEHAVTPIGDGPLKPLLAEIARIQSEDLARSDSGHHKRIRTAVFTARNAPAHERAILSLREWGIDVGEAFFLGGLDKTGFLNEFKPHIFFDDQQPHVAGAAATVPSVHIPFGVTNSKRIVKDVAPLNEAAATHPRSED